MQGVFLLVRRINVKSGGGNPILLIDYTWIVDDIPIVTEISVLANNIINQYPRIIIVIAIVFTHII